MLVTVPSTERKIFQPSNLPRHSFDKTFLQRQAKIIARRQVRFKKNFSLISK